mgnify:FL=1
MPLWGIFILTVFIVLVFVYAGYKIALYADRDNVESGGSSGGPIVAASLGLFAFMLAFTFSIASSRFDTRKQLLLDEVNAIGTLYLRADFLGEPARGGAKDLILEYVTLKASLADAAKFRNHPEKIEEIIGESGIILEKLWSESVAQGTDHPDTKLFALYVNTLNEVIDIHTDRVIVGLQYQIPGLIWGALYFIAILSFGLMGYEIGASRKGSLTVSLIAALTFATVIWIILDLDRAAEGFITVNQQPMVELRAQLRDQAH